MAAKDIRAGGAFVEIFLKGNISKELDKLKSKFRAFGQSVTDIGKKLSGLGAAITAPLLLAAKRFATLGDEVNKASGRTGIAVEELSSLKYAADQSGSSLEDVEVAVKKMSNVLFDAANGSKSAAETLAALGITLKELQGLSPDEQFRLFAERLSRIQDAGTRTALALEIFGKAGTRLLPLIADGATGIAALEARAKALGIVIGKDDAEAATRFGDSLDDLLKQLNALIFNIGAAVARVLQPMADAAIEITASIIGWVKQNRDLVVTVLAVGAGLLVAGAAFITFGASISLVLSSLAGISTVFKSIFAVVGVLLNPILLLGAGLVALAAYFVATSDAGGAALSWLGEKFNELVTVAKDAFSGIGDALAAGDIALAAKILWTGLKLAFIQGTQELRATWENFKAGFVQVAAAAFYGTLEIYQNVKASLLTAFENTTSFLGGLWDGFIGTFSDLWNGAVNLVTKGLNTIKGTFDDTFDSEAANKAADDLLEREKQARQKAELDKAGARENEKKTNVDQIQRDRDNAVADINKREMEISAGASQNAADAIAKIERERADLQRQLDELRKQAAEKRSSKAGEGRGPSPVDRSRIDEIEDIVKQRSQASGAKGVSAQGLFNVAGLQALLGGGVQDRIAKATEETAKNTKKALNGTGLKFS